MMLLLYNAMVCIFTTFQATMIKSRSVEGEKWVGPKRRSTGLFTGKVIFKKLLISLRYNHGLKA